MRRVIDRADKILVACETYLMVGSMTIFALVVVIDVTCRKFFGINLAFMQELGKYLMVWATFIGASLGVKEGEHPSMTLVLDSVPKIPKVIMVVLVNLISAGATAFAGYYAFQQFKLVKRMGSMTVTLWGLPVWALYWIIPAGFFVMAVRFVIQACKRPAEILNESKDGEQT